MYRLREKDAFTSHLLSSLPNLIQADVYTYNEIDHVCRQASYRLWPDNFTPIKDAQEILGRFAGQIPMHAKWEHGDGQALKISDFLSSPEFKKKEIYNEFYRPMRIPFLIGIALPINSHCLITIGHHRSRTDFTERERTVLNMIQPHVLQAYTNAVAVTHMRTELAKLTHAFDQIPQGLISVDTSGLIEWATIRARKLLEDYFGARKSGHRRLPDVLVRWFQRSKTRLDHADEQPGKMAPMVIDHGFRRLHVRMVQEGDRCLLSLEEDSTKVPTEQLVHFGLSRRETEILCWIVCGKSNPEIATILSISVRTIHKHVEHIYLKLRVENRHAAISLAYESMRSPH